MRKFCMTTARSQQICLEATSHYHCVSRCVRRTFLCGFDTETGISYEHRREWIEDRIKQLSGLYCIDICAYAVMRNHYHIVVHINRNKAESLSDYEVAERWSKLHATPELVQRWLNTELESTAELSVVRKITHQWRTRLYSLSWFMRELNLDIAVRANQEEECTGHFWESRYKCQALLDEKALLAAMAYVDLNPVRAGEADTPESSDFTSVKARVQALRKSLITAPGLHPFVGSHHQNHGTGIPFRLMDYLELLDWTGRQVREGRANIRAHLPPILHRLDFSSSLWFKACEGFEKHRAILVGCTESIRTSVPKMRRRRNCGFLLD